MMNGGTGMLREAVEVEAAVGGYTGPGKGSCCG